MAEDKRNFVVKKYSWGVITSADNIYSDCIRNVMRENEKEKVFSLAFPAWVVTCYC